MINLIGKNSVVVTPSDTLYITDSLSSWGREADFAITSVVLATGVFTRAAHGYNNGDVVQVSSVGTLVGLDLKGQYYVTNATTNTFTIANSIGGTTLVYTGANTTPPTFFIVGRRVTSRVQGSLYVNGAGVVVVLPEGHPDTDNPAEASRGAQSFTVAAGTFLPMSVKKVFATATTATGLKLIY